VRRRDLAFAASAVTVLAAYNNLVSLHPWHQRRYIQVNLTATAALLTAAAASGLSPADLGLGRGWWRPGGLAAGLAAGTGAGWVLIAAVPATRGILADRRVTSFAPSAVAYQAAIRIPAGTVLWEEVAFRGVLQAALRRIMPERTAIGLTAAVFGVWHIRPTIAALRANGLGESRAQAACLGIAGSAAMALPGLLLSCLRERSGRLTGPALLHLAANSGAMIAAGVIARSPAPRRRR
jgi:CAAX protease family protein